ncbi:MAG: PAS domain-containing protein [Lachnospiraceae bacterium]|nr:PAS domain-containing protein [Lachnospiraceae bacterium]
MVLENKYLKKAIQKAGYVVIVKVCHIKERKAKLEYISPNAADLGMNVELLNKGMRLTEDYIFPEDREKVIKTVLAAMDSNVKDYTHEYRMVGDDGKLYYVSNEITVSDVKDDYFTVEFYIKNVTNKRKTSDLPTNTSSLEAKKEPVVEKVEDVFENLSLKERIQSMMKAFSQLSELYSVFVDMDGKIIFPPVGPATNMGDFYDLFEKPSYKEYYKYIKTVVVDNNSPTILDREEGGIGKISAAPFTYNGEVKGIWVIGSYTAEETAKLKKVYETHWLVADIISDYVGKNILIESEIAKSRGAGAKLREELARQNILNEALSKVNNRLVDTVDEVLEETFRDAGVHLNIGKIYLYTMDKKSGTGYSLRNYWDAAGEQPADDILKQLPERMYVIEDAIKEGEGQYVVDSSIMTASDKLNIMRYNFKAVVAYPIYLGNKLYGALFFAESKLERKWTSDELRFTKSVAIVVQNMLENAEGDENIRRVNKHLIETYNNFKVGVFVRDAYSGEVLFSNAKMNDMLGYDFTGGDSRVILTDLHDRFDNITGMRKPFITKEKIVNWRSYIKSLDDIMDITEIQIEWLKGEAASLIILRKAKDLK